MKQIVCKEQSVLAYGRGMFGNCLRQWDTLAELDRDEFVFPIVMRYRNPYGGNGPCQYHVSRQLVDSVLSQWLRDGWNLGSAPLYPRVYYNEGTPDHLATLQGELCQLADGSFVLFYNTLPTHMRLALSKPSAREVNGRLSILDLLRRYMTESSYADLEALIETFPMHAIEFTCFDCLVGTLRGRNVIFWEARMY